MGPAPRLGPYFCRIHWNGVPAHYFTSTAPKLKWSAPASVVDSGNRKTVVIRVKLSDLLDMACLIQAVEPVVMHCAPPTKNNMPYKKAELKSLSKHGTLA